MRPEIESIFTTLYSVRIWPRMIPILKVGFLCKQPGTQLIQKSPRLIFSEQSKTRARRPHSTLRCLTKLANDVLLSIIRRTVTTYRYIQHRIRDNTLTQSAKNIKGECIP